MRGQTPSQVPRTLCASSLVLPRFSFFVELGLYLANLPITCSPNSTTVLFQCLPVMRLHGVSPSCPTWKWVNTNAACLTNQAITGNFAETRWCNLASRANVSLRTCPATSWTAFSAVPLL